MVKHQAVNSSNLSEVAYDSQKLELLVIFKSGDAYIYEGVPKNTFDDLLSASSHGSFLNARIKKSFAVRKLSMSAEEAIRLFTASNSQAVTMVKIADIIRGDCKVVNF
jgi:hypothetical protein